MSENILGKQLTLFDRDEKGELVPKEVELVILDEEMNEYKGKKIAITPMPRGEIKRMFNFSDENKEKELDDEIIINHCKNPSYTKEEVVHLKPQFATMLVNTIMKESGLKVDKPKKEAVKEKEDDFGKN